VKVGDLVKCIEGACMNVDGGVGIVIQVVKYEMAEELSIHVQWSGEDLWYEKGDLEVIDESR
jgi:hypothetical protein|tara:strand:+ start:299 stop:484 length:186 start_codon:yes stop_codon:yes gene_type:complete